MRIAACALAVNRRSIDATNRENSELAGAMAIARVLDIGVPFAGGRQLGRRVMLWE